MKTTTLTGWPGIELPDIRMRQPSASHQSSFRWLDGASALVVLAIAWIQSGPLLRYLDPTAAVVDIGTLSLVLLAVVALAVFLSVSRWLTGLLWPVLRDYQRHHFSPNFKSLLPWQKITFYLVIFFGLLYAFVCCFIAVF